MFSNIGSGEVIVVLLLALVVLGPAKLPEAVRQIGRFTAEVRKMSNTFQREFREAVQDPLVEAEARARGAIEATKITVSDPFTSMTSGPTRTDDGDTDDGDTDDGDTAASDSADPTPADVPITDTVDTADPATPDPDDAADTEDV